MNESDCVRRFLFDDLGVRGEWVHLQTSFQATKQNQTLSNNAALQLGQGLAAVVLLSATIKFSGSMILQAQGNGALKTLVAQASDKGEIRGLIREDAAIPEGSLQDMMGEGRLVLTTKSDKGESYQGIVALEGDGLSQVIENYFEQSEQLPTRLWLFADDRQVAGLFLQKLPSEVDDEDAWARVTVLADTVSKDELLTLDCNALLYRLFHEEKLTLFQAESVIFKCQCSPEKIAQTLKSLGRDELDTALAQQKIIEIGCEFCGQQYTFDENAIEEIYDGT